MKTNSIYLIGFFLFLIMAGCHYDEIPIDDPCPDNTNPDCTNYDPCTNSSNPKCCIGMDCCNDNCDITFDTTLIRGTDLNCQEPIIEEVIELPNDEGYLLAGYCFQSVPREALLIHIDKEGNYLCDSDYSLGPEDTFFNSIARQGNELVVTGLTKSSGTSDSYNYVISNIDDCVTGNGIANDDPSAVTVGTWDSGNSIIFGEMPASVIVAGKGTIHPMIWQFNSSSDLQTEIDFKRFEPSDFADFGISNMIPVTNSNFCEIDHHVKRIIQTNDDGFLLTGLINVDNAGINSSRSFLIKTKSGGIQVEPGVAFGGWITQYDNNNSMTTSLGNDSYGADIAEVLSGQKFIVAVNGYNEGYPQIGGACGDHLSGKDQNGFIYLVSNGDGSVEKSARFDMINEGSDVIYGITKKDDDEIVVVGSITKDGTSKLKVQHYEVTSNSLQLGSINFNFDSPSNKRTAGKDIIKTEDNGYLIVADVGNAAGPEGIRIIKTNSEGLVFN